MSLRIAFCGASGTGKTTLAKWASEKYGLPINPVGSRSVAKEMGFDSPYDVDKAGKRGEFQHRLQVKKILWEEEHDAFVTDRTTLDDFSYTVLHDVRAIDEGFIKRATRHLKRYTHVFFCPVYAFCDPGADPQRIHDAAYHKVFDMVLRGALAESDLMSSRFSELHMPELMWRKRSVDLILGAPTLDE